MSARWRQRCSRPAGRGTLALGAFALTLVSGGPVLAAPPAPDVTITVVDNPEQLNEHVNTLSLPPAVPAAAPVKDGAARAKADGRKTPAPSAKPIESAARKAAAADQNVASPGAGVNRSAHPAQSGVRSEDQAAKDSRPLVSPESDRPSAQHDIDDGASQNPPGAGRQDTEQQPDSDETGPQSSPQSAQPDSEISPPAKPPPGAGAAA